MENLTPEQACAAAVEAAGGPTAVAEHFGITPQAVSKWRRVPEDRCLALAQLARWQVALHLMRPDVYGRSPDELRQVLERQGSA